MAATFLAADATKTAAASSFTWTAANLGVAATDRLIVAAFFYPHATAGINSATIGGIGATVIHAGGQGNGFPMSIALVVAAVPTGTTGDIVVNVQTSVTGCYLATWRLTGVNKGQFDTGAYNAASGNIAPNLDTAADSDVIACAYRNSSAVFTTTGVTENFDAAVGSTRVGGGVATGVAKTTGYAISFSSSASGVGVSASFARLLQPGSRHTNAQNVSFTHKLRRTLKASARFDNAQTFYAPTVAFTAPTPVTITAPFHTNAQTFYGPALKALIRPGARFDNAQAFYAPTIAAAASIKPTLHTNAQTFYGPALKAAIAVPLHTNAQTFYTHRLKATFKIAARHDNAQTFYAPTIKARIKQAARFDNAQAFYGPALLFAPTPGFAQPPFFTNAQVFYGPALAFQVIAKPTLHTNAQAFYAPTLKFTYRVTAPYFVNDQAFYGPNVAISKKLDAPFHTNAQAFYGPTLVYAFPRTMVAPFHVNANKLDYQHKLLFFKQPEPVQPQGPGAIGGPEWYRRAGDPKPQRKRREEVVWRLPAAIEVSNEAPPWNPVTITPEIARKAALDRMKFNRDMQRLRAKAKRQHDVEDTILNIVVGILKEP